MPVYSFRTIATKATAQFKEKGSKFLAFAFPVTSEGEIKDKLDALRKEYFDARHHCYAWMLGADQARFRSNDDGEPNHSAGDPILGQIRSRQLTNILVVVVRYFGGTKLGVGGLIAAYRTAADDALQQAFIVEEEVLHAYAIDFDYAATPEVMKLVKSFDLTIIQQSFADQSHILFAIPFRRADALVEKMNLLQATGTVMLWSRSLPG